MVAKTFKIVGSAALRADEKSASPGLMTAMESAGFSQALNSSPDVLISINHNRRLYRDFIKQGGSAERAVLVRMEPHSVYPLQYKSSTLRKYGLVITPGSVDDYEKEVEFTGWPYQYNLDPTKPSPLDPTLTSILQDPLRAQLFTLEDWLSRPITMAMIAGNKVSPLKGANYSQRRKLASKLPANLLEIYGPLWVDRLKVKARHRLAVAIVNLRQGTLPNLGSIFGNLFTQYPGAKGAAPDKHALIRQIKFSLVVENSNEYISEKLLDAILGGSIPIYIGPRLENVGLPTGLAIQSSGDPVEISEIVAAIDYTEIENMLAAMSDFLDSPLFWKSWEEHGVYSQIAQRISKYYDKIIS